jgi:hypothetical protein
LPCPFPCIANLAAATIPEHAIVPRARAAAGWAAPAGVTMGENRATSAASSFASPISFAVVRRAVPGTGFRVVHRRAEGQRSGEVGLRDPGANLLWGTASRPALEGRLKQAPAHLV